MPVPDEALLEGVARVARALARDDVSVAIIAADGMTPSVEDALRAAGVGFGDAERAGLANNVTVVGAGTAKGLEFDAVVIVEPAAIADEGGLRLLYIAVTRAMERLVVVHARTLPSVLEPARAAQVSA